jgi:biopolymer transport protein ExbB
MTKKTLLLAFSLWLPLSASAWWNDDWGSRRQITVDAAATGADIQGTVADFPLLIRLHAGNFAYFAELAENGRDIRFLKDDKTALKHQVEKVDAFNELGLVWVRLPEVRGGVSTDDFWLYYGNANAPDGSDGKGLYDTPQALVYHFVEGETLPQDATAYATHAADSKTSIDPGGWIGAAAKFSGAGPITVSPVPQLTIAPDKGWTFSAWVKIDQPQTAASILEAKDGENGLSLAINGTALSAKWAGSNPAETAPANLTPGKWQHVSVVARSDKLELYLDGLLAGSANIALAAVNPKLTIGQGYIGSLDEVQVASVARSADWIKLSFRTQSPDFAVLGFGQDESAGSAGGPNYFTIILQSLTVDGWVVIALCGVMFIVSAIVMVLKGLLLSKANKENRAFLEQYRGLAGDADPTQLDRDETDEEREMEESDVLSAIVGEHDHFQGSPVYHVYHAGVQELKKRLRGPGKAKPLSAEALEVLRARLDSAVVREGQKLNRNMVLLTIAISGGPFLGLLGTVLGVMITFAVIAATGDVNINSIAPGISGALLATVAGLAVAIPALFGYNYLLTQIKDITAEMRVFTDEFLSMVAERMADQSRES